MITRRAGDHDRAKLWLAAHLVGLPLRVLVSHDRKQATAIKRFTVIYVLREATHLSFPLIGALVNRDHSTAMHGHNVIAERAQKSPPLAMELERMVAQVRGAHDLNIVLSHVAPTLHHREVIDGREYVGTAA